jgi:glycosyltransferase involved in cell wall biosynthesis
MAAGLPIIASNFPLWREIIEEIGCGLLVNPLKPQEIAQAIQYLLENPEVAETMGKRGQEAVRNQYNWERESQNLLNLYQQMEKS